MITPISKVQVGKRYPTKLNGDLEVMSKLKNRYYLVKFVDTGYTKAIRADGILIGSGKDWLRPSRFGVGYMGVGVYASTLKGKSTQCCVIWKSMLERCYCPKFLLKSPTYKECTVADEWHNYQVFAKWFYNNYPTDGQTYQLDKDFKVKGNKLYSKDTCTFLTQDVNKKISNQKQFKFINPDGELVEITNLTEYCKTRELTRENMGKVHRGERPRHKGWTKYVE